MQRQENSSNIAWSSPMLLSKQSLLSLRVIVGQTQPKRVRGGVHGDLLWAGTSRSVSAYSE